MQPTASAVKSREERALDRVRFQMSEGHTGAEIAGAMGVAESTLSRWLNAERSPTGKSLQLLLRWFDRYPSPPLASGGGVREAVARYDSVIATVIATGENRARLGVVQGYAQFVLDQLVELARKQQQVVDGIRPFAEAEGTALAANVPPEKIPELLASIRRYQAQSEAGDAPADPQQGTG
jgi:transcriptional regulator with XRE-family HTH domain